MSNPANEEKAILFM